MIKVTVRLRGNGAPGAGLWLAAGVLLLAAATELATETFTMTTALPAPSAVYTRLVTTGSAYFAGNVGVRTASPAAKLDVEGSVKIVDGTQAQGSVLTSDAGGLASWQAAGGAPSGTVAYFNLPGCPSGWSEFTSARGLYLVGLPPGGALAAPVGAALSNLENRPAGSHSHPVSDPGHSHSGRRTVAENLFTCSPTGQPFASVKCVPTSQAAISPWGSSMNRSATGITVNPAGAVAGTNAPYIQLLVCRKS